MKLQTDICDIKSYKRFRNGMLHSENLMPTQQANNFEWLIL